MSKLNGFRKKLNLDRVLIAEQVAYEQTIKKGKNIIKECCEKDAEFAREISEPTGKNCTEETKDPHLQVSFTKQNEESQFKEKEPQ